MRGICAPPLEPISSARSSWRVMPVSAPQFQAPRRSAIEGTQASDLRERTSSVVASEGASLTTVVSHQRRPVGKPRGAYFAGLTLYPPDLRRRQGGGAVLEASCENAGARVPFPSCMFIRRPRN